MKIYLFLQLEIAMHLIKKDKILLKKNKKKKENINQPLSNTKVINSKRLKSHLLGDYNSTGNSITLITNKYKENQKLKNTYKLNKNKIGTQIKKNNNCPNNDNVNNIYNVLQENIKNKRPEEQRNNDQTKIISGNNTYIKNKINNNSNNNSKNNFKITVGLKHDLKNNSQKIIKTRCSPNNSSSNFYFDGYVN